jgi:hypothetical protein
LVLVAWPELPVLPVGPVDQLAELAELVEHLQFQHQLDFILNPLVDEVGLVVSKTEQSEVAEHPVGHFFVRALLAEQLVVSVDPMLKSTCLSAELFPNHSYLMVLSEAAAEHSTQTAAGTVRTH